MINARSIATLGIGFGALAIASLGFIADESILLPVNPPAISSVSGGGGGGHQSIGHISSLDRPKIQHKSDHELIAMLQAEDDAMLHIIMNAVIQELI